MTSAPRSASVRVQIGPAQPIEKSTTRTPSSGRRLVADGFGTGTRGAAVRPACGSPMSGTRPPGSGGVAVNRCTVPQEKPDSSPIVIGTMAPRARFS